MHTYIHAYTNTHIYRRTYTYIHLFVNVCIHLYVYVWMYLCIHLCMHVYLYSAWYLFSNFLKTHFGLEPAARYDPRCYQLTYRPMPQAMRHQNRFSRQPSCRHQCCRQECGLRQQQWKRNTRDNFSYLKNARESVYTEFTSTISERVGLARQGQQLGKRE